MSLNALGDGWTPLLAPVLAPLGDLPPDTLERARALLDLATIWNKRINLNSARDPGELCDLYFGDAVQLLSHASAAGLSLDDDWVDIGSGGGPPGLSMAVLEPRLRITLVEPRAKRVSFLRQAVGTLGLISCHVKRARSEQLQDDMAAAAVSKATFEPAEWARVGSRLARDVVWVLLARYEVPEIPGWQLALDAPYSLTHSPGERRLIALTPEGS